MKPAPFDYVRAETLAEAHDVLAAEGGDASVIAGGQTLVPLLSMRMARPKVVSTSCTAGARRHRVEDNAIRVGARCARPSCWPGRAGARQPLLAQALPWVGHAQTRARGTVCGSVALADPSAELPLVLSRSAGEVDLSSKADAAASRRRFLHGLMSTARRTTS
jgi:2-furoyl-CoA dehydrogenase FAD binding subunit